MFWVFLAIVAHFFWAMANIGDKYVVGKRIQNPYVYIVWVTILGFFFVLFTLPFFELYTPPTITLLWLLLAGVLYFVGGLPYMRAMQIEEPTRINIWWNLIPLFALVIGWLFLGEKFDPVQLVAFFCLLSGAIIASLHVRGKKIVFSKAVLLMVLASILFAIYGAIFRYITAFVPFVVGFFWVHLAMFVSSLTLFLFPKFRQGSVVAWKGLSGGLIVIVIGVSIFDRIAVFVHQWALSLGPVALVFSMEGFQVIFVFVMAILVSLFAPHLFKEELDKRNIAFKLAAILLMIIGVVILSFS